MKQFRLSSKEGEGELQMLDTAELGTPREGKTIKTGNIMKEGRGSTVFGQGIQLKKRFFTLYVEDGRPTLKYLNSSTSEVLGVCDLTGCVLSKSKNPRKDASGIFAHCMRLDMVESPVNTNIKKLKLTLCFSHRDDMNSWYTALMWAINFKVYVQQRDMEKAKQAKEQSQRRPSLAPAGPLKTVKEPSWAKRKSAPDALQLVSADEKASLLELDGACRADSRPTAKYLDGQLTQIGTMSLTGDQRFLVLNGSKKGGSLFVYDSVAQGKMVCKIDILRLERLEIANKMVGTSLIIKEKDRSGITFYAHDAKELVAWGVAIALNYLACLPLDAQPAEGVSEQLLHKALASTKQSEKQIDELMDQVYAIIGNTSGFNGEEEDSLRVLQDLLAQMRGFDMNAGAQRNDAPGIASLLVKNGVGKAKESFGLIFIAVEHLVQPLLERWHELKPRVVMEALGWIMDLEELLSDFSIQMDPSVLFSNRPEFGPALAATCPHFIGNFRFFNADMNGVVEDCESSTQTIVWIELRAQRILLYSRIPEAGMQVSPIAVHPISRMRSFKRVPAPALQLSTKRDDRPRPESASQVRAKASSTESSISARFRVGSVDILPICTHDEARQAGRQCLCCVAFSYVDSHDLLSCFVCMSNNEQTALEWLNALQLTQRALQSRLTGPVANEIPLFKQLFDGDPNTGHKVTENAVHDKCLQEFTRVQDKDLSTMLEACDRLLQYMKQEVRNIQRWDLDDDECSLFVATAFAKIILETVTNYLRNSADSCDVDFIEHDEAFYLCKWSLSFQAALEAVGVYSTDVVSYDVCMVSHSLELINNYALALSQKLATLFKTCANRDFASDFQFEKSVRRTEADLPITDTPVDAFSFLNGIIYKAVATGHQLAIAFTAFACIPVLKVFVQQWNTALQSYLKASPSFDLLLPVANGMRHCCNLLVSLETDPAIESLNSPESIALISAAASILHKPVIKIEDLLSDLRPHFQDAWRACVAPLVDCICTDIREILDNGLMSDKLWNGGSWCCVMQYLNIVDDESSRTVKPFPQLDSASQTVTIVATLQSYYEEMERDLDRRILMLINPLLATRVVQLYVAKVLIPGVIDSEGLFEYRTKRDFENLVAFFSDSESHPRRSADGKPHITEETKEMIANMGEQLRIFEDLFLESCKIDSVMQEEDDFGNQTEITHFVDQFERLLLETDITVGVARRVLEKRHDLKNRAFNDLKKDLESKCVEAVEDIMQRRHMKSQPLANASALKLFCLAPCDDVPIPWLQQNKSKLGAGAEESKRSHFEIDFQAHKDEKAFAKRGSILGAFTASISEALSSSLTSQSSPSSAPSDAGGGIFMALKRKGSALSEAIFNPSEGQKASDASSKAAVPAKAMPGSGGRYELVQSLLEDMGSKDLLPRFKEHDYSDDVIAELSPADLDEMIGTLQMNAGQKIKFRRELKKRGLCQG